MFQSVQKMQRVFAVRAAHFGVRRERAAHRRPFGLSKQLAAQGFVTGASGRNWAGYGKDVKLADHITTVQQSLLCDPQTSGGLLVACSPDAVDAVLDVFRKNGFDGAAVVGEMVAGTPGIEVV